MNECSANAEKRKKRVYVKRDCSTACDSWSASDGTSRSFIQTISDVSGMADA
jgi:hypothetical protein